MAKMLVIIVNLVPRSTHDSSLLRRSFQSVNWLVQKAGLLNNSLDW